MATEMRLLTRVYEYTCIQFCTRDIQGREKRNKKKMYGEKIRKNEGKTWEDK